MGLGGAALRWRGRPGEDGLGRTDWSMMDAGYRHVHVSVGGGVGGEEECGRVDGVSEKGALERAKGGRLV